MISFAIPVCTELESLKKLLECIDPISDKEIVILYDTQHGSKEVLDFLNTLDDIRVFKKDLDNDFASFRNYLNSKCDGDWIFQLDADEYLHDYLVKNLHRIVSKEGFEACAFPRINTVKGITKEDLDKWEWVIDDQNRINFPDYQIRLYKNQPDLFWKQNVHEQLVGFEKCLTLPPYTEMCIYHPKTLERQTKQNEYYSKLEKNEKIQCLN